MTVKELINRLQQVSNQEMKVVVSGYESGFDDIQEPKFIIAYKKIDNKWWDGKYEQTESSGQGGTVMLLLPR